MKVRALEPDDAPALTLEDDRGLSFESMRSSLANVASFAVLGAFDCDALVGMAGIIRLEKLKSRHRAMIWGMFVTPTVRRRGVGSALLGAAIDHARSWPGIVQVQLPVFETAEDAGRIYRRAGFREWKAEPRAVQWEGGFGAEHHLVLDLA